MARLTPSERSGLLAHSDPHTLSRPDEKSRNTSLTMPRTTSTMVNGPCRVRVYRAYFMFCLAPGIPTSENRRAGQPAKILTKEEQETMRSVCKVGFSYHPRRSALNLLVSRASSDHILCSSLLRTVGQGGPRYRRRCHTTRNYHRRD